MATHPKKCARTRHTQRRGPRQEARESAPRIPLDQLRARAFEIFQDRIMNQRPGDPRSDLIQARRELARPAPGPAPETELDAHAQLRGETLLASAWE